MAAKSSSALSVALPSDREIVMTRVFDAPRRLVFKALTTCEHLKHWWGPRRLTVSRCEMDFRPGGRYRIVQRGPDGAEYGWRAAGGRRDLRVDFAGCRSSCR